MNLKKLTALLFAGVTAAAPFATNAQNPTILQGNYISNVFGQANFVLNPNAQTNVANVTLTNATATRSTTTPLVATSEWNVTVTSANGTAAWATRSFDEGMKNQNCEARFTYRGFQATSKAQIKQGANVIAELTLTPSATDPRIASINFPCGDLSAATTFVITDSATLSGVHEIGGIYVGLATNQANVAQAEMVVTAEVNAANIIPTAAYTTVKFQDETLDKYGEYDPTTGIFTAKRAGHYYVKSQIFWEPNAGFSVGQKNFLIYKNSNALYNTGNYENNTVYEPLQIAGGVDLNVGETISLRAYQSSGSDKSIFGQGDYTNLTISRFPLSSELVVTPETQNVWGGSRYYGSVATATIGIGSAEPTGFLPLNSSSMTARRTLTGRCNAPTSSADDLGCSIENMPVGSYKIEATGLYNLIPGSSTNTTICSFEIYETTSTTSVSNGTYKRNGQQYGIVYQPSSQSGIFQNSAVATRNFVIRANKTSDDHTSNNGGCQVYIANSGLDISSFNITVTPLDNDSNSALYVQGPVKGSGTGTAIPAGYVGEVIATGTYSRSFSSQVGGAWRNITEPSDVLVTPPGNYLILFQVNSGTQTNLNMACLADTGNNLDTATGPYSVSQTQQVMTGSSWPLALSSGPEMFRVRHFRTTTTATHYIKCYWDSGSTVTSTITGRLSAIRLN